MSDTGRTEGEGGVEEGTRGTRTRRREKRGAEAGIGAPKYRRVNQALNASNLSQKYQSKFQRHEVTDECIQKCMDQPKQWDIYLSSILPIAHHKRAFLLEFSKTKERDEQVLMAEKEHEHEQQQSSFSDTVKNPNPNRPSPPPWRIQQPDVYVNPNIMKIKMEGDYVPVKEEPTEPELETEPEPEPEAEPEPMTSPVEDSDGELGIKTDVKTSQASAPNLKEIQIILTRIDSKRPGSKLETTNANANKSESERVNDKNLSEPAVISKSPPPQDSDSDSDFVPGSDSDPDFDLEFDSRSKFNLKSKHNLKLKSTTYLDPSLFRPNLPLVFDSKSTSDFDPPRYSVCFPKSKSDSAPPRDSDSDLNFDFNSGTCSGSGSLYTWKVWWDIVEKLKGPKEKEKDELCFQIIAYLALLHTHKFPVKKDVGFSGWTACSSAELEQGFRLLEEKYKLIKINVEENLVHLNVEKDTAADEAETEGIDYKWLRTLIHRTSPILLLLPEMINSLVHILDPFKTSSVDTERMLENLLLLAKSSGRGDGVTSFMNMIPQFWFFLFQLALRLLDAGRWEDAFPLFRRVAQFCERQRVGDNGNGDGDKAALMSRSSMALILADQGLLEEALALYQQILPKLTSQFGSEDEATVGAMCGMAGIFKAKKEWVKALGFYRQVYQSRKKRLGVNHDRTKQVLEIIYEIRAHFSKE